MPLPRLASLRRGGVRGRVIATRGRTPQRRGRRSFFPGMDAGIELGAAILGFNRRRGSGRQRRWCGVMRLQRTVRVRGKHVFGLPMGRQSLRRQGRQRAVAKGRLRRELRGIQSTCVIVLMLVTVPVPVFLFLPLHPRQAGHAAPGTFSWW